MQADRLAGQGSIFDLGGEEESKPEQHPPVPSIDLDKGELLRMEKETLGVYVSEHPLQAIRDQLRRKVDCALAEAEKRRDGEVVTVGGIVGAIKQLTTKKGEPMELTAFEATPERREVRLRVDARKAPAGLVRSLAGVVKEFPGEIPVIVAISTSQGETTLALGPDYRVKPEPDFFAEVKSLLGEAAVA
jgi:DNA polymerase-3 subunit alpha